MATIAVATRMAERYPERVVVLYGDEASFYCHPSLAPCLRPRHDEPLAELGTHANYRLRVGGALNRRTGQVTSMLSSRFTVTAMKRFLRTIRTAYPDQRIYLVWDNWPVHFHADVTGEAVRLAIRILRLPTYAPWENPIEKLWRWMKQEIFHHHRMTHDWDRLKTAVRQFLDRFAAASPELLRSVGLLPR
jgi:DDE superfamily endonuclease